MHSKIHTVIAMSCLLALLVACKLGNKEPKEVKASCDMRGPGSGSSSSAMCLDFYEEPNAKVKSICSEDKGYTLANKPCDHATALGGCKKENSTQWYYSSSRHSTADDVKKECPSDFIAP